MSWIRAFLELNKSLFLKGLLLLMAFLLGLQMGQSHLQRQWDAERHQVELAQAREYQKSADIKRTQERINHEISNEFNHRSARMVADRQSGGIVWVRSNSTSSDERLSSVPESPRSVTQEASNPISVASGNEGGVSCGQLAEDAAQTTLMLIEIQRWYDQQLREAQ